MQINLDFGSPTFLFAAKTSKFDLQFPGGAGSFVKYSNLSQTSSLTVSAWVRYSGKTAKGVFLMLANLNNVGVFDPLVVIRESTVTVSTTASPSIQPFSKDINDGLWHQVIVSIHSGTGKLQIYQDKQ